MFGNESLSVCITFSWLYQLICRLSVSETVLLLSNGDYNISCYVCQQLSCADGGCFFTPLKDMIDIKLM